MRVSQTPVPAAVNPTVDVGGISTTACVQRPAVTGCSALTV
ncbi:hypothetical protein [uncultured Lamprocystis sp.]|nr:hypothetical protein [uncultured Lamprocystis sp.]